MWTHSISPAVLSQLVNLDPARTQNVESIRASATLTMRGSQCCEEASLERPCFLQVELVGVQCEIGEEVGNLQPFGSF